MSGLKCYRLPEIARNFMQTVKTKFSCRVLRHLIRICSVVNVIFIGQKHKCVKFYARCAKDGQACPLKYRDTHSVNGMALFVSNSTRSDLKIRKLHLPLPDKTGPERK